MAGDWAQVMTPDLLALHILGFLAVGLVYGQALRVLATHLWPGSRGDEASSWTPLLWANRSLLYFTLAVPLLGLLFTFAYRVFVPEVWQALTLLMAGLVVWDLRSRGILTPSGFRDLAARVRSLPRETALLHGLLLAITAGGFLLRFFPLVGNYVYPADDPRLYSFLTKLVIDHQGYPFHVGVLQAVNHPILVYPYMQGFPALAAVMRFHSNWGVPQSVAVLSQAYSALLPLAVYAILARLSGPTAGLVGAALTAFVFPLPMTFFAWGGNAEYVGYFLAANLALVGYEALRRGGRRSLVLLGVGFAATLLVHPYSFLYLLAALPYPLYRGMRERGWRAPLAEVGGALGLGLLLLAPLGVLVWQQEIAPTWDLTGRGTFAANQEAFQSVLLSRISPLTNLSLVTAFAGVTFLVIGTLVAGAIVAWIAGPRRRPSVGTLFLGFWALGMFLLHENGPYGLYFVPYPFWGFVDPTRTFFFLVAVPLSLLTALAGRMLLVTSLPLLETVSGLASRFDRGRPSRAVPRLVAAGVLVVVLLVAGLQLASNVRGLAVAGQHYTPVAPGDVTAFVWIEENLPPDAVFWVNRADAGEWILVFTSHRVFPFRMLMNDAEALEDADRLDVLMRSRPSSPEALTLLAKWGITHVYLGAKEAPLWLDRSQPQASDFRTSEAYATVYSEGGVAIFEVRYPAFPEGAASGAAARGDSPVSQDQHQVLLPLPIGQSVTWAGDATGGLKEGAHE